MILLASIKMLSVAHLTKTLYSDKDWCLIQVFHTENALNPVNKHLASIMTMVKWFFSTAIWPNPPDNQHLQENSRGKSLFSTEAMLC